MDITVLTSVIRLNLDDPSSLWETVAPFPDVVQRHSAVTYADNIFVIGGTGADLIGDEIANTRMYRSNDNPNDLNHVCDLGRVAKLATDRYGCNGNKLMTLIGVKPDYDTDEIDLFVWG